MGDKLMNNEVVNIEIKITISAKEFWSNVLGSAWETWDWWRSYDYSSGADWDKPGTITVAIDNPEDEAGDPIVKTLNVHDLAKAYGELSAGMPHLDWQDLDACYGDAVMQQAVFSEVVYG
jgi:hypothetical protein